MHLYFTSSSNGPSGGGRVLNETVNLCRAYGIDAWLALPERIAGLANFLPEPAPIVSIESLSEKLRPLDVVVFGWNSEEEFRLLTSKRRFRRILWQHGTLIAQGPGLVGDAMLRCRVAESYWNVSQICGAFISEKYALGAYKLVQPFFLDRYRDEFSKEDFLRKSGILIQERRGFELAPLVKRIASKMGEEVIVLKAPFTTFDLEEAIEATRFFVGLDRGVSHRLRLKDRLFYAKKSASAGGKLYEGFLTHSRWVKHEHNLVGFPMSPAQAARQGNIVIGFPMGGGLEWMDHDNSFLVDDDNKQSLRTQIKRAIGSGDDDLYLRAARARERLREFSPERTFLQLSTALGLN